MFQVSLHNSESVIIYVQGFTVERYIAICHPMRRSRSSSSFSRVVRVIIAVWVVATLCSLPIVLQYEVVYIPDGRGRPITESAVCSLYYERRDSEEQHGLRHSFAVLLNVLIRELTEKSFIHNLYALRFVRLFLSAYSTYDMTYYTYK